MAATNSGFYKKMGAAAAAAVIATAVYTLPPHIKEKETSPRQERTVPYKDIAGIWTDCDGNTKDVSPDRIRSDAECDAITQEHLEYFSLGVAGMLQRPVPQETFNSLVSLSYNIGLANLRSSTALRQINAGNYVEGCQAYLRFSCITVPAGKGDRTAPPEQYFGANCVTKTFNKKFVRGLWLRHHEEMQMCLKGFYQ